MKRWQMVALGIGILAVALAAVLVLRTIGGSEKNGGVVADGTLVVECRVDTAATFELDGVEHSAQLVESTNSSARVIFSSDRPSEVTLSERNPVRIDLTSDAIADAEVTLTDTSDDSASIEIVPITFAAWDETDFAVAGGFRPYKHWNNAGDNDFAVVPEGDGYVLFYTSEDRKLNWERYDQSGALITRPALEVGVIDVESGDGKVRSFDAALVGERIAIVTVTNAGTTLRLCDPQTMQSGQLLYLGRSMSDPVVVAGVGGCYVIADGGFDPPQESGGPARIMVTEVDTTDTLRIARQEAVTETSGREADMCCDAALDADTNTVVVAYKHRTTGEQRELRLMGIDADTLEPAWTSVAGPAALRGTKMDAALTAAGGTATLVWRHDTAADGGQQLHVAAADVGDGTLTRLWDGRTAEAAPRLAKGYPCALLGGPTPALAYFDTQANPATASGSPDRGRFALWGWEGDAWSGAPTLLDGGKPLLADPLIDLNAFEQMPPKAICGAPVALKGVVTNRGSRDADTVVVTASIDGEEVGSVALGKVKAASDAQFTVLWTVPAEYTQETADVEYALTTTSDQYTLGNDAATHAISIRQKGLVTGRVVNASSDIKHGTGWYPGLQNARVSIGDHVVLTDIAGTFSLDDLEFGTYEVTIEREGFNTLTTEVTVSRTRPLAFVPAEMDDHGVIEFTVVDEAGTPLEGVDVYLHDYGEHEKTPASGVLAWDISARTYTFSFVKRGYYPVAAEEYAVELGATTPFTVTMREAKTAFLGGRVVDKKGAPVGGASVTITDATGTVVAQPVVSAGGTFEPVELPGKPAQNYTVTVSGNGITITENVRLFGGDDLFFTYGLVPGRGEMRVRSATEGYTSWMIKAGWPGIGEISGADMFVWYGNYAISVGAEYWEGTDELSAVDVTVWGGTYETHATKSEIDFSGWFEAPDTGSAWDITRWADLSPTTVVTHGDALLTIAGAIVDGFSDDDPDEWVMTGQGNELLTWKEARSDFAPQTEFDSSAPLESMWSAVDAVPRSFAIPIVIGGSSVQQTAVRVDQVDVVRLGSGDSIDVDGPTAEWYSYQGPEGTENNNGKRYQILQSDVPYDEVVVYVWITVQKYWQGAPGGTCFDQREQQVVVFHPGPQTMEGFIASGSLYKDPTRMAP